MLPNNSFVSPAIVTPYRSPRDQAYDPFLAWSRGGVAISDPSQGRNLQNWTAIYVGDTINVQPEGAGSPEFTLVVGMGVTTISLAFDNNMRPAIAYQNGSGNHLFHYSTVPEDYDTITIADATSGLVATDDVRDFNNANSDVIWGYTRSDENLYWRMQRDRYEIERLVGPAGGRILVGVGMNVGLRFQFKLAQPA